MWRSASSPLVDGPALRRPRRGGGDGDGKMTRRTGKGSLRDLSSCWCSRCVGVARMGGVRLQPAGAPAQPGAHGVGRHRRAAACAGMTSCRAGRGGAGLRRPRARRAGNGDEAARAGASPLTQPGTAGRGRGRAGTGARPAVRAEGSLSRPQGQRELRPAAARPGRSRGPPAVRAPLLQRRGARLNNAIQRVPDLVVARGFGFREAEFFQTGEAERAAVQVELP